MENLNTRQSKLWERINKTQVTKDKIQNLAGFKSSDLNFNISIWDPKTNGVRYLKALLYNIAGSLSSKTWRNISKIKNRDFGNPITVKYNGENICLDYLQAAFEIEFIEKYVLLDGLTILEIGAGYGRTCHAIMSNHEIKNYFIVDLKNCLELSKKYLRKVLGDADFKKINFILAKDICLLNDFNFDLCINIDSLSEMDRRVAKHYLNFINRHCVYFYVKNPVGKYLDRSLDGHPKGKEAVSLALSTGLLRDIVDIHDNRKIEDRADKFVKSYRPGKRWKCIRDTWARPWTYYWQAMYKKLK